MIFNSIRWRLQAWYGLLLVIVLAAFGLAAYQVVWSNQLRRVDQELEQRLGALFRPPPPPEHPGGHPPEPPPEHSRRDTRFEPGDFADGLRQSVQKAIEQAALADTNQTNVCYYILWQTNGSVLASWPSQPPQVPLPQLSAASGRSQISSAAERGSQPPEFRRMSPTEARTRGEYRELFRFMQKGGCALVGRSVAPELAAMHRLGMWLVAAGGGVLLVGLAGGWWVASRAIQPIEEISAAAVKIAAGDLSQRVKAADTDSELGRLASVLNSTFARLEAAFAHQARFTSDASHELRTPLAVILAQTQNTLSRDRNAQEYREALEACRRAALRMRSLAESLLQLARLDAGQEPLKREVFDLARVTREAVELLRPLAAEQGVEIRCELQSIQCVGDAERISQVAINLVSNAIQYNRQLGKVRVSTSAQNGFALLTVADTGSGIAAEDVPHIFERFYRADKSRSHTAGHTGLGLAISKAIADAHGATLDVSSQPGTGSTFSLKFEMN